jgi:signal transduction histidine kinase
MEHKANILLIDDDPGKLLTYEVMLAEVGENLLRAHSGMEGLEQLLKNDISLVLMDVCMPGMDGFEAAQMIHEHPRFQNIPIIFVSGVHITDLDRLKGYGYGAVDYVSVPVVPELLRAKIKVFLELRRKTQQLELLNAQITVLRDHERRRIARELHDSVGQLIAALAINNAVLQSEVKNVGADANRCLSENAALIEEIRKEVRTISHLLHPPLLDEAGLASALHCYVAGFAERSKIDTRLEIPTAFGRLPDDVELAIFRVVQECLTNIHRHSESPTASIRIVLQGTTLTVEIEDNGVGISPDKLFESSPHAGIGLRGMRERLRLLGGTLKIHSVGQGTRVIAVVPISESTVLPAQSGAPRIAEQQAAND